MAYKFPPDEPLPVAIVRCAREQLDRAISELSEGIKTDPVAAVHNARKAIKKERSMLRLARGAMSPTERRHENAALREAARALSGVRDAEVSLATLDNLHDHFAGQVPARTFDAIRERLQGSGADQASATAGSAPNDRAIQALRGVRVRVDSWKVSDGGWSAIDRGLVRSYKRGRKAFIRARRRPSLEELHNWRKRVKDLWYHERLLTPSCGPTTRGHARDAHRLADLLGDDHDLGMLRVALTHNEIAIPVDVDAVVNLIDHRRAELQTEATHIGERLYAESPKAFRRRMRRSWHTGQAVATMALEQHPAELSAATRAAV